MKAYHTEMRLANRTELRSFDASMMPSIQVDQYQTIKAVQFTRGRVTRPLLVRASAR